MTEEVEPTPEPGIYYNVSDAEYDSWTSVRQSTLAYFCEGNTPADAFWDMFRAPEKETAFFDEGDALHLAVLQPDEFDRQVVEMIPGPFQSNKAKAAKAEFLLEHEGQLVLPHGTYDRVLRMRDALLRYRLPRELLTLPGKSEVAIVWDDPEWGLRCKAKVDRAVREWRSYFTLAELKTMRGRATQENIKRAIGEFGYHRQEAMYRRGVEHHTGPRAMHFVFIFAAKDPPHTPGVCFLDSDDLRQGTKELTEAARLYRSCTESNIWPGPGLEPRIVTLPAWKRRQRED